MYIQRDERRKYRSVGGGVAQRVSLGLRDRLPHGQSTNGALLQRGNRSSYKYLDTSTTYKLMIKLWYNISVGVYNVILKNPKKMII